MNMETPASTSAPAAGAAPEAKPHRTIPYVPGYVLPKILMLIFCLGLITLSLVELLPAFSHLMFGGKAQAEAIRVIKERPGDPELVFTDNARLEAAYEKRDRVWTFWMEYQYTTADGRKIEFRAPFGTKLKSSYKLRDADGLPTTVGIWYSKSDPTKVTLPAEMSTWFLPSFLLAFGVVTGLVISIGLIKARTPVDMPDLSQVHFEDDTRRIAAADVKH
jgi:hypothetical protein